MTSPHVASARRNAVVLAGTGAVLGLLFLFPPSLNRGGAHNTPGQAVAPAGPVSPAPATPGGGSSAPGGGSSASSTRVVNGTSADTRYGRVQVQLRIRGGRIISAKAIDYPQGSGTDRQINGFAIPLLQQETVAAQSARIDSVSGATYTSDGYQRSLQAALDAAHL
jgi:FMN-binding domain